MNDVTPIALAVSDTAWPYQKVTFPDVLFVQEDNEAVKTNAVKTEKNKLTFFIYLFILVSLDVEIIA